MRYLVFTLLLCLQYCSQSNAIYYWRDFQKRIPFDAYSPGQGSNQENIYIGQAFLFDDCCQGIYPTSIIIDKPVIVPRYGARQADNFLQILCSDDPENFQWIQTNSTHFHLMNTENELVRGGIEAHEWISIGRVKHQGSIVIGKIMSADIGQANMWFVHNGKEKKVEAFEVLTYKKPEGRKHS